jgi:hypothetical protein
VEAEVKSLLVDTWIVVLSFTRAPYIQDIFSLILHFGTSHEVCVMFIWGAW